MIDSKIARCMTVLEYLNRYSYKSTKEHLTGLPTFGLLIPARASRDSSNRPAVFFIKTVNIPGHFHFYKLSSISILESILYFTQSHIQNHSILQSKYLRPYLASNRGKL